MEKRTPRCHRTDYLSFDLENMKLKILISYYLSEGGTKLHRAYFERDFKQAESDLDLINSTNPSKTFELVEVDTFDNHTEILSRYSVDMPCGDCSKMNSPCRSINCQYSTE